MEGLFEEFEFNDEPEKMIYEFNGYKLPEDYIEFMKKHNGGEGNIGKDSYGQFLQIEELQQYYDDYELSSRLPNCFAFGTDLGGNHWCYNFETKQYFALDAICNYDDAYCFAKSLEEFLTKWDN